MTMMDLAAVESEVAALRDRADSLERFEPQEAHELRREADLAERVGTGDQLMVEHFRALSYAERVRLHAVNPPRYEALSSGRDPGQAWTPTIAAGAAR